MPLGSPKAPKDFCSFRGIYVLWAHLLPCSFLHTSCLCSIPYGLKNTGQSLLSDFPFFFYPPPPRKAPKHSHKSFMSISDLKCGWGTGGLLILRINNLTLSTGHPWPSNGRCSSQHRRVSSGRYPLSHLPQVKVLALSHT